jgi:RNase P protein component
VRVRALEPGPVGPGEVGVAYALGRRVGGAVVRNRIRRRLRAAVSELAATDGPGALRPGAAYLWSADVEAASCPYPVLQACMAGAVRQAHGRTATRP